MKKIIVLIFLTSQLIMGRDILIGDRIDIVISGTTEENIRKVFKDFEIESIEKSKNNKGFKDEGKNGFKVSLRSYTAGEYLIDIGDKRLVLNITSSLENGEVDLKRDLSTGEKLLEKKRFPVEFLVGLIFLIATIVFILTNYFKKEKNQKLLKPNDKFNRGLDRLREEEYTYEISYLLREYTDSLRGTNLLSGRYEKSNELKEVSEFLKELDHIKFSKRGNASKETLVEKARELAKTLDNSLKIEDVEGKDREEGKDV